MKHYAGIDVSLNSSSVCVVDESGKIVREVKVASEPVALINWFKSLCTRMERIGLEAGPLSQWLSGALRESGLPVELLETRHVKAALSAMPVKTDRNDARGLAQLMRLGWFRPVHCKSIAAQEVRALLTARKLVQSKLYDIEMSLRGILRGFGLKVGPTTSQSFAARINHLVAGRRAWKRWRRHCFRCMRRRCASSRSWRSRCDRSAVPMSGFGCSCRHQGSARWWRSPTFPRSTIQSVSPRRRPWARILGSPEEVSVGRNRHHRSDQQDR